MAISYEDSLDPERARTIIEKEVSNLERAADNWIKEVFFDGRTNQEKFSPGILISSKNIAEEFMERYRLLGWNVYWDKDVTRPWFYFTPPKVTKPEPVYRVPPEKDPWWAFWR